MKTLPLNLLQPINPTVFYPERKAQTDETKVVEQFSKQLIGWEQYLNSMKPNSDRKAKQLKDGFSFYDNATPKALKAALSILAEYGWHLSRIYSMGRYENGLEFTLYFKSTVNASADAESIIDAFEKHQIVDSYEEVEGFFDSDNNLLEVPGFEHLIVRPKKIR